MTASIPPTMTIDPDDVMPTLLVAFAADPGIRWLYPDDGAYQRAFPEAVLLTGRGAWDVGTVDVAQGGSAVAVWDPPGSDGDGEEVGAMWAAHFQTHIEPARLDDVYSWGERIGTFHPTDPHWYLGILAVTPRQQGRGHGTALLRAGLERCDRDGLPAYLESGNPRNRELYERHGFEVMDEVRVADSPPFWPMFRAPVDQRRGI